MLQKAFPQVYIDDLRRIWVNSGSCLYPTYLAIDKALSEWNPQNPPFALKKKRNIKQPSLDEIDRRIQEAPSAEAREVLEEYRAARAFQLKKRGEDEKKERERKLEEDNFEQARADGTVFECGCCFAEHAMNRMVHCDSESLHVSLLLQPRKPLLTSLRSCQWFCQDCARSLAESQIGLSKHQLRCMSVDGCDGGFSMSQREIFLDVHSQTALDRIEQEAALREAGIENLETCPFCPFAMVSQPSRKVLLPCWSGALAIDPRILGVPAS